MSGRIQHEMAVLGCSSTTTILHMFSKESMGNPMVNACNSTRKDGLLLDISYKHAPPEAHICIRVSDIEGLAT